MWNDDQPLLPIHLIDGDPGAGKTTLSLQYLLEGARIGEKGLYVTLSETRKELTEVAASHGWTLEGIPIIELSQIEHSLTAKSQNTLFQPAEVELSNLSALLLERVAELKKALKLSASGHSSTAMNWPSAPYQRCAMSP